MALIGGFNVHKRLKGGHQWSAQDQKEHLALLDELQPSAMLYLDWIEMAREVKKLLPNCHVIHRQFFEFPLPNGEKFTEGSIWQYETFQNQKTQDWLYERIARDGEGGIIVHVLNEPNGYGTHLPRLVGWLTPLLERLAKAGIKSGGPNWGVGHPDENRFDELAPLLALMTNPAYKELLYYLAHEYWAHDGIGYGNGRVGRFEWLAGYLAKAGRPVPDMIITEFGIDDKLDGSGRQGWKHAGITEEEYASQDEAVRARYEKWKCILGFTRFVEGQTGDEWDSHDTHQAKTFKAALVKRSKELRQATPPPPAPPVPRTSDPRFQIDYRATPTEAGSNTVVRQLPSAASPKLRVIEQTGLTVKHIPPVDLTVAELEYQTPGGVLWQVVRLPDGRVGYCHSNYIRLARVTQPLPPPAPPDYVTRAEAQQMAEEAAAKAVAKALAAFQAELYSKFRLIFSEENT